MTEEQAQNAVTLSALVVGGVFAYRKLVGPSTGNSPQTAHFVVGFGFVFIVLAILAQAAPPLGGSLAILVATGDLLANGQGLVTDLQKSLNATARATGGAAATTSTKGP
jgi:hypothetical protein